jgi:hypothetical protein
MHRAGSVSVHEQVKGRGPLPPRPLAEDLLRDVAFVLRLTRVVKQAILKPAGDGEAGGTPVR